MRVLRLGVESRLGATLEGPRRGRLVQVRIKSAVADAVGMIGRIIRALTRQWCLGNILPPTPTGTTKQKWTGGRNGWGARVFLGRHWRTCEGIVGIQDGVRRAAAIRRVGAHRRRALDELGRVHGMPWSRKLEVLVQSGGLRVRWLAEDRSVERPTAHGKERITCRPASRRDVFFTEHGLPEASHSVSRAPCSRAPNTLDTHTHRVVSLQAGGQPVQTSAQGWCRIQTQPPHTG